MSERVVIVTELRTAGLVGEAEQPHCVLPPLSAQSAPNDPLPNYDEFVSKARRTAAGAIDRSAVDFAWAATALKRGHSVEVVMAELARLSLKAARLSERARGEYVRRTVEKAGRSIA